MLLHANKAPIILNHLKWYGDYSFFPAEFLFDGAHPLGDSVRETYEFSQGKSIW